MTDHTTNETTNEIPYGYCHCGCGQLAPISPVTRRKQGHVAGQPIRFIIGHQVRTRPARPLTERFWEKITKGNPNECWLWTGATDSAGYGQIQRGARGEGRIRAHRLSYELHHGQISEDAEVCHSCDNPACVNPSHLWLGTHRDNMQDCKSKGRNFTNGEERPRGDRNPATRLTEDQVRHIRELCNQCVPRHVIAAQFGVSKSTITAIFLRVNWKHI